MSSSNIPYGLTHDSSSSTLETPKNLFVTPANIHTIEAFMNRVGYQGVVEKKKEDIQYPRFIKLIVADLMKKFPNIPKRLAEDYHSIKDYLPLTDYFKEYETMFMNVDVPMNQPQPVVSTQGTYRITPSTHRSPTISAIPPKTKKRKQMAGESSSPKKINPGSHKDNPEVVDDDDDKEREKQDDEIGSLEVRNEETQTTIPTPLSSPRNILSSDKKTFQELTDIVLNPIIITSKHSQV
ncbi:hypothetical protein Tco_0592509 [Tanacetum coccineum]